MDMRQPEKALQWLATPQSIDRGPDPKVCRYMKIANGRPSGEISCFLRRARPREPSHLVLVARDSCGTVANCYSSVIEVGIVG